VKRIVISRWILIASELLTSQTVDRAELPIYRQTINAPTMRIILQRYMNIFALSNFG
jgi:hypothetical protein